MRTPNGHHVTWNRSGLHKQLHNRVVVDVIDRIEQVHLAKLPNVETGSDHSKRTRSFVITRMGRELSTAIRDFNKSKEEVIAEVRAGIDQLHALGLAHTDIFVKNVFVDMGGAAGNAAFLDDLEYVCDKSSEILPGNTRIPAGYTGHPPATAEALDELQFEFFCSDVGALY